MADSGHRISNGSVDFYSVYKEMIETELVRAPGAEIECKSARVGNVLRFSGSVTNHSGITLSSSRNDATIYALVWENASSRVTARIVRAVVSNRISGDLATESSFSFTLETPELSGVNWDQLHSVVLVDYRPAGSSGAYDMLQAVIPSPSQ
jgi:hypothetical protein